MLRKLAFISFPANVSLHLSVFPSPLLFYTPSFTTFFFLCKFHISLVSVLFVLPLHCVFIWYFACLLVSFIIFRSYSSIALIFLWLLECFRRSFDLSVRSLFFNTLVLLCICVCLLYSKQEMNKFYSFYTCNSDCWASKPLWGTKIWYGYWTL